tara:strand:+ start:84 stop:512 length:429 start_codon:yes stop_codon:yes gene_type:complete
MDQAKNGDTVRVHYTGELEDGTVFDSSEGKDPLEFTIGKQQVIPGFESAVTGMNPGEVKKEAIPVDQAYGPRNEEMVLKVNHDDFPEGVTPELGQTLNLRISEEQLIPVSVINISEEGVVLDANHPLAGMNLVFNLELVEIL